MLIIGPNEKYIMNLIDQIEDSTLTICIDPDASVASVRESVDRLFENQPVATRQEVANQRDDIVLMRDGEIVASSSAEELLESILLINSDVYITGSRGLEETELPDILKALEETPLRLRGYPDSDSEKLLFITVSRAIERLAYETGEGTLCVGFQRLSRLVDEPGTKEVYEQLCNTHLDIHAYGVGDTQLSPELGLTVHPDDSQFYRRCWFVVFEPPSSEKLCSGLFAVEREPNHYDGFWTFRPRRVEMIRRRVEST